MTTKTKTKLAVFVPAEGNPVIVDLASGTHGSELETLQFAVGGWVQVVSLAQGWEGSCIWVNEEAKLIQDMPFNQIATQIWAESFEGYGWGADDYILGNAVITLEADSEGDTMGMELGDAEALVAKLSKHYRL